MSTRLYFIWSIQHTLWWRAGSFGYTRSLDEAGRYPQEEAARIVEQANIRAFHECMIPVEMVDPLPEEGDRQMMLLSLALCALDRPGFDDALGRIADQLNGRYGDGRALYDEFKRLNADRFAPRPLP